MRGNPEPTEHIDPHQQANYEEQERAFYSRNLKRMPPGKYNISCLDRWAWVLIWLCLGLIGLMLFVSVIDATEWQMRQVGMGIDLAEP